MARQHGKSTVVKVNAVDLTQYTSNSQISRKGDAHDVTGGGVDDYVHAGGLKGGTFTMDGTYDTTAVTGPRAALQGLLATSVPIIRQPEGTGTGKPQDSFNAVMTGYSESNPVSDMVKWSAEFTISGAVTTTPQA